MAIETLLGESWKAIIATTGAVISGALVARFRDNIISLAIRKINPEKFVKLLIFFFKTSANRLIAFVDKKGNKMAVFLEQMDQKFIEPFKSKNPQAGALIEKYLGGALRDIGKSLGSKFTELGARINDDFQRAADKIEDKA